jgi:hypothetical protein
MSSRNNVKKFSISLIVFLLITVVLTLDIKHASGLISIPIAFLPKTVDSTNVVPLPRNGLVLDHSFR